MNPENEIGKAVGDSAKTAVDAVKVGMKMAETIVKKVWSIMDAASQKPQPSEYLSQKAISAIQGKASQG